MATWLACCLSRGQRAPVGEDDIVSLVAEVGEQRHAGGTFVFREGDASARVHILREGSVELSRVMSGRRVVLQLLVPGDVFGDVPALLGEPEPFDARAVVDSTLLSLDTDQLFTLLATRRRLAQRWMVSLADRMSGLQMRLVDLLAGSLEAQIASYLLREGGRSDGRVEVSHGQLASLLGVQRTSVQRVLKQLEDAGLVELGSRRIELVDRGGLASLVDDSRPADSGSH